MLSIYQEICKNINSGVNMVLVTVLNKEKASRNFEAQMIVRDDFSVVGSIGGGIFEVMAIKLSRRVFESRESIVTVLDSGMPCSFISQVLLEYIDSSDKETLNYFNLVSKSLEDNENFVMVTNINQQSGVHKAEREILFEQDYYKPGNILTEKFPVSSFSKLKFSVLKENDNITVIFPRFNRENAYIFGAGYIAQKLSQITSMLDFNTVILDDREEFANRDRFPEADSIVVLESFDSIKNYMNINENSYIIIVTRGHMDDTEVLSQVIRSDAKYIGMLGSRKKRDAAYSELMERGFNMEELRKVHSPIGININGKTPEEITVSIAAELVKVRRENENGY